MKLKITIISLILLNILFSCTPSVRFTSNKFAVKKSNFASKTTKKSSSTANEKIILYPESEKSSRIRKIAETWIGTPYCVAGISKECSDCSGFVQSVYKEIGISLPRVAKDQYIFTERILDADAITGDLVFFKKKGVINHVGIYLSGGTFIHASITRGVVIEELSTSYYAEHFAGFGRVLEFYSMK